MTNRIAVYCFLLFYFSVHFFVAFFSVRQWPFTDYPMFSNPIYPESSIYVYQYDAVLKNGSIFRLPRAFYTGHGIGELNLSILIERGEIEKLKMLLKDWMAKQNEFADIAAVIVSKVEAIRGEELNQKLDLRKIEVLRVEESDENNR